LCNGPADEEHECKSRKDDVFDHKNVFGVMKSNGQLPDPVQDNFAHSTFQ
jgi:hypothetical protein